MHKAKARHILVATEESCNALKNQITSFDDFDRLARENSLCPSGRVGGDLGLIPRGKMVPEFDAVVFNGALNQLHGPVQTRFGYHLIWITTRL